MFPHIKSAKLQITYQCQNVSIESYGINNFYFLLTFLKIGLLIGAICTNELCL